MTNGFEPSPSTEFPSQCNRSVVKQDDIFFNYFLVNMCRSDYAALLSFTVLFNTFLFYAFHVYTTPLTYHTNQTSFLSVFNIFRIEATLHTMQRACVQSLHGLYGFYYCSDIFPIVMLFPKSTKGYPSTEKSNYE